MYFELGRKENAVTTGVPCLKVPIHRKLGYGLSHQTHAEALAVCHRALGQPPVETPVPLTWQTVCARRGEAHPERCPACGQRLVCTGVIPRGGAPPPVRAGERAA
jgi:hypothetical protein